MLQLKILEGKPSMNPKTLRVLGILLCIAAAALAVLSLKRAAGLGMNSLATVLLVLGIVLVRRAKSMDAVQK